MMPDRGGGRCWGQMPFVWRSLSTSNPPNLQGIASLPQSLGVPARECRPKRRPPIVRPCAASVRMGHMTRGGLPPLKTSGG